MKLRSTFGYCPRGAEPTGAVVRDRRFAIGALALGFGALYPQFETQSAAQIPTSFGGLVYMMAMIALLGWVIFLLWQASAATCGPASRAGPSWWTPG
jgi:hypothetical protein